MKILIYNIGYAKGLNGSILHYFFYAHRYIIATKKTDQILSEIAKMMKKYDPEICFFVEIEAGKKSQAEKIKSLSGYDIHAIENKYKPDGILEDLPFFKNNCNAVFTKEKFKIIKHSFRKGMKRLIYEVQVSPDLSIFLGHFALSKKVRKIQFEDLAKLIDHNKKIIVGGDFNVFDGEEELSSLCETANLKILNSKKDLTFPAHEPKKALDLFLCSKDLNHINLTVLPEKFSDHRAVLLEI